MGEEGLEALRREESRVERLLSDGKMSLIKQNELRYEIHRVLEIHNTGSIGSSDTRYSNTA